MGRFSTAADRWAGVGPYYAMFPASFANRVISTYTRRGQYVLDPFAGRGTAVFSAAAQGRCGIGIEINPVGWVYTRTKLGPADAEPLERRIRQLAARVNRFSADADALPPFFKHCFSKSVRQYLLAARADLNWRQNRVDRTAMALLLVYLHGKRTQALSNQMRQTKSMSPAYAINWWRENGLKPPDINVVEFLEKRIEWRYAKGIPNCDGRSRAYLGNSTSLLKKSRIHMPTRASLLLTSPPYYGVTNYHYDQWLRLWLLGEEPNSRRKPGKHRGKFENRDSYEKLLRDVFSNAADLVTPNATIYVRTGRQKFTYRTTRRILREVFPDKQISRRLRPFRRPTQTRLFGDHDPKVGEVDLIMRTAV